ncbi:MAG: site-2 protease family protein [Microcoleaceae cyanobacterium]
MMYVLLHYSVSKVTRTPIWLLWLVLITPILIWLVWTIAYGEEQPVPVDLILIAMLFSSVVYWYLVHWGRRSERKQNLSAASTQMPEPAQSSSNHQETLSLIEPAEEETLRSCFPWSVFPLQKLEMRSQAVICRGQLRSQSETAYKTICQRIREQFGDRFLVVFQADSNNKPFFALVPNPYQESTRRNSNAELNRPLLALALMAVTLFTTTIAGAKMAGITAETLQLNPGALLQGLPYGVALMAILGAHESAHYLMSQAHRIRSTLPYFIPVPFFLGTLGAFIQMRSPFPNRRALFDVSVIGPWVGLVITLPVLLWGLAHSEAISAPAEDVNILNFDAIDPSFSFLLTVLSKISLGDALTASQAIDLHPVAIAGYLGLIVTAFNLLPIGQLDGGHMIHAMLGQRNAVIVGQLARLMILVLAVNRQEFWLLALLLLILPLNDEPALNDITELNNARDMIGLVTLGVLLLILLPIPGAVAQLINY